MTNHDQKSPAPRRGPGGRAARSASHFIGARLKSCYDQVLSEPLPVSLLDLLERLDRTAQNGDERRRG